MEINLQYIKVIMFCGQ